MRIIPYHESVTNKLSGFANWVEAEMKRRGWSRAELARRAGLSRAAVSDVLNLKYPPGPEFCRALARAFGYSQEYVFRLAGLIDDPLPPGVSLDGLALAQLLSQLPPEDREEILALVQLKLARRKGGPAPTSTPTPSRAAPARGG